MSSGSDILAMIERMLGDTRGELETVAARSERTTAELARVRQAEIGVLAVLARLRLREIESGELADALDETGRQVTQVLAQRAEAQNALQAEIAAAQQTLAKLGQERSAQHDVVDEADRAVDAAEAEAQRRLAADAVYRARLDKAEASDRVADVSEEKAQAAQTDRVEKGKPYEADRLFSYLWARGYGTSQYRSWGFTRLLDNWVARVAQFEPLRRNYWMLSELPARFADHAAQMRKTADDDVGAVRALDVEAAEAAGVPERERALAAEEEALASIDKTIEEREAELTALVEKRTTFASGDDEHSRRCTELLSDTFRREKMKTLRERATATPTPEDDAAVDQLTAVRAELPRLEEEAVRYKTLNDSHRERGVKLEEIRKLFKEHRYDAVSSEFVNGALIATLLAQLLAGSLGVPDVWDALRKQQRHRNLAADPRFGSGRFPRGPGGSPWRFPGGGGGWPKGGGFGGGGFRTGGGFGRGGGFRTGGGF
jgi:hypothetical protein